VRPEEGSARGTIGHEQASSDDRRQDIDSVEHQEEKGTRRRAEDQERGARGMQKDSRMAKKDKKNRSVPVEPEKGKTLPRPAKTKEVVPNRPKE